MEITIRLPEPHSEQERVIDSPAKRKVVRAGRRGGKTVGVGILAVEKFLEGRRVLYGAPTTEQVGRFWTTVVRALEPAIDAGFVRKNETEHLLEFPGTEQRIRAKTCWNADTLRGDYADLLMLDEYQMMNEDTWEVVGAPMLLLVSDVLGRVVIRPGELQVGVVTAFVGAPVLILLVRRRKASGL